MIDHMSCIFQTLPDILRCKELGKSFHDQLEAQLGHENHPEDPDHELMVGQALLVAVEYAAPELAEKLYNEWAIVSGYEPIGYIYQAGRSYMVDIKTALVKIDTRYKVTILEDKSTSYR